MTRRPSPSGAAPAPGSKVNDKVIPNDFGFHAPGTPMPRCVTNPAALS